MAEPTSSHTQLRTEIVQLEQQLYKKRLALEHLTRNCRHDWMATVYDPEITPAGSSDGDPVGTMGIDRQLPHSWPETRKDRWKRMCPLCGAVEYTYTARVLTSKEPVF